MFMFKTVFTVIISMLLIPQFHVQAEPLRTIDDNINQNSNNNNNNNNNNGNNGNEFNENDVNTCEIQLSKYRKFLFQAIINFEDVCNLYEIQNQSPTYIPLLFGEKNFETGNFQRNYKLKERRSEVWAFIKILMAQFNDVQFANVIRDAVIEHCRIKSIMQHDEKRNSVVLGKKQRFHSWGGKRSQSFLPENNNDNDNFNGYFF